MTERIADRLREAAAALKGDRIALGDLAAAHGPAAQGTLLVLTALPCMLPIPGTGSVLGWGLAALALAMWRGHDFTQLPRRVAEFQMPQSAARRVLTTAAAFYGAASRLARQRWSHLTEPGHRGWVSAIVALMAILIVLPIPFGNVLPALAVTFFGLGFVFRDGLAMLAGAATAALAVAFAVGLGAGAWLLGAHWLGA